MTECDRNECESSQVKGLVETTRVVAVAKTFKFPIEIPIFFYFFVITFTLAIYTNQVSYQVCTSILYVNRSICANLEFSGLNSSTKALETEIQPYTSNIKLVQTIVESVIPAGFSFFIGPWSDQFGRKPLMIWSLVGNIFSNIVAAVVSYLSMDNEISPWFFLIGSLGIAITGGITTQLIGIFSYLADITTSENRPRRMALSEASLFLGLFAGCLSTSYILDLTSPALMFAIASILLSFNLLYVVFGLEESIKVNESLPNGFVARFKELFKFELVIDLFMTCFKPREKYNRAILWIVISCLCISIFILEGPGTVFYLFFRERLEWGIKEFSLYNAFSILLQFFGLLFGSLVLLRIGLPGMVLALISNISFIVNFIIIAFASTSVWMYIGVGITFLKPLNSPMFRAMLAQIVQPADVGKVYSLLTCFQSITPIISAPLYTLVYDLTLVSFPGAIHLISASLYGVCVVLIITVIILQKKTNNEINYGSINS